MVFSAAVAEEPKLTRSSTPVSSSRTEAVAEIRKQDNAFSVMMESYQQIQELMIESDYDKQTQIGGSIANPKERERVIGLAKQARAQRLTKLASTMASFATAYGTTRKESEHKAGTTVASTASRESADEQLHKLVPFQPRNFRLENTTSPLVPAAAHMLFDDKKY